jgi:hypothetical protein
MPCKPFFGLAKQSHYPAAFFDRQSPIVEQRSAMQNDPPLAFDQEATNVIVRGRNGPTRPGWQPCRGLQFQHKQSKGLSAQCGPRSPPALRQRHDWSTEGR